MTNREIAKVFDLYAKLLILHDKNSFKIRSYQNSYNTIRQISDDLIHMDIDELQKIPGIGKSIASKIIEIKDKNTFEDFQNLLSITPDGVVEMLKIKGIGAKKVRLIWKELGVQTIGELEYAIKENRLTLLKGFGKKTQENILSQIDFLNSVKGYLLIDKAQLIAKELIELLNSHFDNEIFSITGELRREMPSVSKIVLLATPDREKILHSLSDYLESNDNILRYRGVEVEFVQAENNVFGKALFETTGPDFFIKFLPQFESINEEQIFEKSDVPFIPPVFRDSIKIKKDLVEFDRLDYIEIKDIKGVIHNHTIWSDGTNSVLDMANHFKSKGFEYMVVTDHSKSAFYANGVRLDQIDYYLEDILNADNMISDFKIYSGIESDILINGSLDYNDKILERFDLVIASVHSVLRMDKSKATERLLKAISNPYTKILGHMTGRILLAREGYPLDYDKIFEACSTHNVSIELNANPHRLDIDWTLIEQAQSRGVSISINPDAHSKNEVDYIKYGVSIAQKGLLKKENCLNVMDVDEFRAWLKNP